ncbi:MAG: RNA ligase family protein [Dehalococcoidales bacterium]
MNRKQFREAVFARDNHECVACGDPAQDAHHLMERRLFEDGGYQLDNGASVCGPCHIKAEKTEIAAHSLRLWAGIQAIVLPPHLYPDYNYDKWGNIVMPDSRRLKGELFFDEGVQKILPDSIKDLFSPYVKHPRLYHVPWTGSKTKDDKIHDDMLGFYDKEVVVTEKRDGEQTSVYWDGYYHARSVDSDSHPSQGWNKREARTWCYDLPRGWRACGENLYAIHAIKYTDLPAFFEIFGIWTDRNICLSWDDTVEWCQLLNIQTVPVLYSGIYDETLIRNLPLDTRRQEGYVIRLAEAFTYAQFRYSTAKFVRPDHVASTVHNWRRDWRPHMTNSLRKGET